MYRCVLDNSVPPSVGAAALSSITLLFFVLLRQSCSLLVHLITIHKKERAVLVNSA